jgi:DNA-binding response OmpR family regulator
MVKSGLERGEEAVSPRATVDANEQLLHDGDAVPLTPKAFAVLRRLVEDGGQVATRRAAASGVGEIPTSPTAVLQVRS